MILLVVALAVALQQGVRWWLEGVSPTAGAQWIWIEEEEPVLVDPRVLVLARDFSLAEVPPRARLAVLVDEEYRAFLNGRFLGGNRYRAGAPLDVYEVAEVLVPGANRLIIEARSGRGSGGALASLVAWGDGAEPRPVIGTDASWSLLDALDLGTLRGWADLPKPGPVLVWARPPIGRWGQLRLGEARPLPPVLAVDGVDVRPASIVADSDRPATFVITWPTVQTGILSLEMSPGSSRVGQIQLAVEEPSDWQAVSKTDVIAGVAVNRWQDVGPRRFRVVRVRGLTGLTGALVRPVTERVFAATTPPAGPEQGVFGLEAPPRLSRVDEAVASTTGG
jgi:hypothetical protein